MDIGYMDLRDSIYNIINDLHLDASAYWEIWARKVAKIEVQLSLRKPVNFKEMTSYQLKIEHSGPSFVIRWLYIKFTKNNGKIIRLPKSIAVPRNGKYTKANFPHAADWELELILDLEAELAPIRVQLKHLMKIHQTAIYAVKSTGGDFKSINVTERVEGKDFSIKKYKESLR